MNDYQGWLVMLHAATLLLASFGCESPKEPVLKIETPNAKIEVDKTPTGTTVDVETAKPATPPETP